VTPCAVSILRAARRRSTTTPRRLGVFCGSWDGAVSVPPGAPWSGMQRRSGGGSRSAGRRLKKSPPGRPHHRLHRRKRTEPAPAPLPHLGAPWTDARVAVSLQLEDTVGDGRCDMVELLFPAVSRHHPSSSFSLTCCATLPASC